MKTIYSMFKESILGSKEEKKMIVNKKFWFEDEGQFCNYKQRLFISSIVYGAVFVCQTSIIISDEFLKHSKNTTEAFPHCISLGCSFSDPGNKLKYWCTLI